VRLKDKVLITLLLTAESRLPDSTYNNIFLFIEQGAAIQEEVEDGELQRVHARQRATPDLEIGPRQRAARGKRA